MSEMRHTTPRGAGGGDRAWDEPPQRRQHVPRKRDGIVRRDGIVGLAPDPQDVERSTIVRPGKGGHCRRIWQVTYCAQTIRAVSSRLGVSQS